MDQQKIFLLLLQLLRPSKHTSAANEPAVTITPQEWSALFTMATKHKVAPLLHYRLCQKPFYRDQLPVSIRQALQQAYDQQALHNLRLYHDLRRVVAALQEEQIPVVLLKGAYLAWAVYPHRTLRSMVDIDLLVPPTQLFTAATIVQRLGYKPATALPEQTDLISHHLPRFLRDDTFSLELHWTITRPDQKYTIDIDALWQLAQPVTVANMTIQALHPVDLLLHLCLHASYQHLFAQGVRFLCDIAVTLERYAAEIDWSIFVARAQSFGWERGVYLALKMAHDLMGAPVPATVLTQLQPSAPDPNMVEMAQALLGGEQYRLSREFSRFWEEPNRSRQIRHMLTRCFPSQRVIAQNYGMATGSPHILLGYGRRLYDLVQRYYSTIWQRWRGHQQLMTLTRSQHAILTWLEEGSDRP